MFLKLEHLNAVYRSDALMKILVPAPRFARADVTYKASNDNPLLQQYRQIYEIIRYRCLFVANAHP